MSVELSEGLVLELIQSKEEFPINLDDAWQWLGYAQKQNALRLLKSRFEEGLDFSSVCMKNAVAGRPSDQYRITVDCFKCLGMMAATEKGNEIRRYFLECERQLMGRQSMMFQPSAILSPSPTMEVCHERIETLFSHSQSHLKILSNSLSKSGLMAEYTVLSTAIAGLDQLKLELCHAIPSLEDLFD